MRYLFIILYHNMGVWLWEIILLTYFCIIAHCHIGKILPLNWTVKLIIIYIYKTVFLLSLHSIPQQKVTSIDLVILRTGKTFRCLSTLLNPFPPMTFLDVKIILWTGISTHSKLYALNLFLFSIFFFSLKFSFRGLISSGWRLQGIWIPDDPARLWGIHMFTSSHYQWHFIKMALIIKW